MDEQELGALEWLPVAEVYRQLLQSPQRFAFWFRQTVYVSLSLSFFLSSFLFSLSLCSPLSVLSSLSLCSIVSPLLSSICLRSLLSLSVCSLFSFKFGELLCCVCLLSGTGKFSAKVAFSECAIRLLPSPLRHEYASFPPCVFLMFAIFFRDRPPFSPFARSLEFDFAHSGSRGSPLRVCAYAQCWRLTDCLPDWVR